MSKQEKLLQHLAAGATLTTNQIATTFGLKNPQSAIDSLRSQGHCIYGNKVKRTSGRDTVAYRIGKPSKAMVRLANATVGASLFSGS